MAQIILAGRAGPSSEVSLASLVAAITGEGVGHITRGIDVPDERVHLLALLEAHAFLANYIAAHRTSPAARSREHSLAHLARVGGNPLQAVVHLALHRRSRRKAS